MKSLVVLLALSSCFASAHADSKKMIGKSYLYKNSPGGDTMNSELAEGYFLCMGASRKDADTGFTALRKGLKAKCNRGNGILALTRSIDNAKGEEVLDAVDIKFPPNHQLNNSCMGAEIALSKYKSEEYFTEHIAAWNVVDNKLVAVTDLKKVRCVNDGY